MDVELHISTDDGSRGHKGFVTDLLEEMADADKNLTWHMYVGPR